MTLEKKIVAVTPSNSSRIGTYTDYETGAVKTTGNNNIWTVNATKHDLTGAQIISNINELAGTVSVGDVLFIKGTDNKVTMKFVSAVSAGTVTLGNVSTT